MSFASAGSIVEITAGDRLLAVVAERGSAAHPYARSEVLLRGPHANRNLADIIHFLCVVHGGHPGAIDYAARQAGDSDLRSWLQAACQALAVERAFLARLAAAAGPSPGTPSAADSDVVVLAQCHAIEMLSRSERRGCAAGAAMALVLDWRVIRQVLDVAANRFGVDVPPFALDDQAEIANLASGAAESPSVQRAMLFGAEQISVQHHGLWDLLEARQEARSGL